MLPIITNMTQVRMSLTMPEDLATQCKRRPEKNTSVGCPLLHKQEVLSCAIQFHQLLGHPISATFTNCYDGHEGPRVHEGMGVQLWKMYIRELFDKKPPSTRQVPSPLKCIKESKQSMKKYS